MFFNGVASNNFAVDLTGSRVSAQVPPGAVSGPVSVTRIPANGGPPLTASSINPFLVKPRITSISPLSGPAGMTTVRILGTGLGADVFDRPVVRFNGVPASQITGLTATDVAVTLAQDASDGPVTLATRGGTTSSREAGLPDFNVISVPVIDRVEPSQGRVGDEIRISGSRFGAKGGNLRRISFGGVNAFKDDVRNTNQVLFTTVPAGAATGFIRVDNADGAGFSPGKFRVVSDGAAPTITSFSPQSGSPGTAVLIAGSNFDDTSVVRVNGATADRMVNSTGQITALVPVGASSGPIGVSTAGGSATSATNFIVIAGSNTTTITGVNPSAGSPNTQVTISGTGLNQVASVMFNTVAALIDFATETMIVTSVPAGATTGRIVLVRRDGGSVLGPLFTVSVLPAAPSNLNASAAGSQINVNWNDNSTTEVGFNLERRSGSGGYQSIAVLTRNVTSFADANVAPGVTYCYRVKAFNAAGESAFSNEAWAMLGVGNLPTIGGFSPASGAPGTRVSIRGSNFAFGDLSVLFNQFEAAVQVVSAFEALATVPQGAQSGPIRVINAFGSATSAGNFIVTGGVGPLPVINDFAPRAGAPGTSVSISGANFDGGAQVSFNGVPANRTVSNGFSISATVPANASSGPIVVTTSAGSAASPGNFTVMTGGGVAPPNPPGNLVAESGTFEIALRWGDNSGNEDGFRIERQDPFGNFVPLATVGANTRGYVDSPLSPSATYTYRVKAFNAAGESLPSNTASARPLRGTF